MIRYSPSATSRIPTQICGHPHIYIRWFPLSGKLFFFSSLPMNVFSPWVAAWTLCSSLITDTKPQNYCFECLRLDPPAEGVKKPPPCVTILMLLIGYDSVVSSMFWRPQMAKYEWIRTDSLSRWKEGDQVTARKSKVQIFLQLSIKCIKGTQWHTRKKGTLAA